MKKLVVAVLVLLALMAIAANSRATTFYPGMDAAITDSSMKSITLTFARPAVGDSVIEPLIGSELKRVTGITGTPIPGVGGGAVWGADARHHYSKDQPWSADEKYYWVENSVAPSKIIFDSLNVAKWTNDSAMSPYCACLDSSYELRMHPTFPNIVVSWIKSKGAARNKLIWWTLDSCITKRSWVIPAGSDANLGWISEGTLSDNGRWTVLGTSYAHSSGQNPTREDTLVVVDMMYPHEVPGSGIRGGRVGPYNTMLRLPFADNTSKTVGNVNISTKGTYVYAKYEGTPEYGRVWHRGSATGPDTTLLTLFPHTMYQKGLRMGASVDSTLGWVACMSHADMNETTSGVEVIVGGERNTGDGTNITAWCETSSGTAGCAMVDSGRVIMVELATGLHRHVSGGRAFIQPTNSAYREHGDQHTSGRSIGMRGWHLVTYACLAEGDPLEQYADEMVYWKLDGNFTTGLPTHSAIRLGRTNTNDQTGTDEQKYRAEAHGIPSPTGRRVMFVSNWMEGCGSDCGVVSDVKSYVYDIRTTGTRQLYVKAGADTNRTGFTTAYPTGSFSKLNRLISAGNGSNVVAMVGTGTIPTTAGVHGFPNPMHAPTLGKRYYVYGKIADPSVARLAVSPTITQSGLSIRGVTFDGDLRLIAPASFDSIANFSIGGNLYVHGADRSVITNGTVSGSKFELGTSSGLTSDNRTAANTIDGVTFTGLSAVGGSPMKFGSAGATPATSRYVDSLTYRANRHTISNTGTVSSWPNDHVMRSKFIGNRWAINHTQIPAEPAVFFRDSSAGNLFLRDTILAYGAGGNRIAWATNTNATVALYNTNINSWIDSCYVLSRNGPAIDFSNSAMKGWSITRTVAVSSGAQAMRVGNSAATGIGLVGRNYIGHNTFASDHRATGANALVEMGLTGFDGAKTMSDTVRFTNNIVYSFRPGGITTDSTSGAGFFLVDTPDSANVKALRKWFISNWNAYGVYPMRAAPADRSISYARTSGLNYAKPGATTGWNALFEGRDIASVYGSPGFDRGGPDSTFGLTTTGSGTAFDPAISPSSIAVGKDSLAQDIGAVQAPDVAIAQVSNPFVFHSMNGEAGYVDTASVYISNVGNGNLNLAITSSTAPGSVTASWDPASSPLVLAPGVTGRMVIAFAGVTASGRYLISYTTNETGNPTRRVELIVGVPGALRTVGLPLTGPGVTLEPGEEQ